MHHGWNGTTYRLQSRGATVAALTSAAIVASGGNVGVVGLVLIRHCVCRLGVGSGWLEAGRRCSSET